MRDSAFLSRTRVQLPVAGTARCQSWDVRAARPATIVMPPARAVIVYDSVRGFRSPFSLLYASAECRTPGGEKRRGIECWVLILNTQMPYVRRLAATLSRYFKHLRLHLGLETLEPPRGVITGRLWTRGYSELV